jgi:very-short-patch-repair endonuclease
MNEENLPPPNVIEFLSVATDSMGRMLAERWNQDVFCKLIEGDIKSPIEQLFYIACVALCASVFTDLNPPPVGATPESTAWPPGVYMSPQHRIGRYRVDFMMHQEGIAPEDIYTPIVVELDGHAFHDKDKTQRAYEKARDRDLVRAKFRVLHFTGSEVVQDPFRVAYEALDMLAVFSGMGREGYDPKNPLGYE